LESRKKVRFVSAAMTGGIIGMLLSPISKNSSV
jgi:hypothetical protein